MTYETSEAAHEASAYTRSNACCVWPLGNSRTPDEMSTSLTNCVRSAPDAASTWAKKVAACCRTRRYSVICSGR
jgi:hypothetical protein